MNIDNRIAIESFIAKGNTNTKSVEKNTEQTIKYLEKKYCENRILNEAIRFSDLLFIDAFKADLESLKRIGFYPSTEAQYELEFSIKSLLTGNYKSSADHMRRALELVLAAIYFSLDNKGESKAKKWLKSKESTPAFSKCINLLNNKPRFKDINKTLFWSKDLKKHYHKLCDYVHVKGINKGYRILNLGNSSATSGNRVLPINEDTIDEFIELYQETVQNILVVLYLYNPILLIGMPMEEKYGSAAPVGGYFNDIQANKMKELIPEKYKDFFEHLASTDEEVLELKNEVLALPDVSYI